MRPETDIASEEYEDLLARVESVEKTVKDLHIGGDVVLGNVHALGLISGIFRSGTGIKDSDLDGFQMDGNEFVGQASGADKFKIDAATGLITIYAGNAVDGTCIDAGTLPATATNFEFHIMDGAFTDDSPSAGSVAWANVDIIYDGTKYDITNGNTDKKYIYWDKSASTTTFQTNDTKPTLIDEDFLACINVSGTAVRGDSFSHIEGAKISAGTITADEITGTTLSAIYADLGTITAGSINMFTGTWDSNATGFRLTADEICGQSAGADQVLLAASTGKLTAGAGEVTLDADGITILGGYLSRNKIIWEDADENLITEIYAETGGTTGALNIVGYGTSATYPDGKITLTAYDYESNYLARVSLYADSDGTEWVRITPELQVDTINEQTGAAGVTIDSLLIKDGAIPKIVLGAPTELTLDTDGAITVTQSNHIIDTFEDAGADDLVTISGGSVGQRLVLRTANAGRDVTVKDASDNIYTAGDCVLGAPQDKIELIKETATYWVELNRSINA